jgi:hypothetical protein
MHHACKDRLAPEDVASLCLHALNAGPFPDGAGGVRIYESAVDDDGLTTYQLRSGQENPISAWYGSFWREIWFESFTGTKSGCAGLSEPPPDLDDALTTVKQLLPLAERLVSRCENMGVWAGRKPLPARELQQALALDEQDRAEARELGLHSPAFGPATIALLRDLQSDEGPTLAAMAQLRATGYRRWRARLAAVERRLRRFAGTAGRSANRMPLLLMPSAK